MKRASHFGIFLFLLVSLGCAVNRTYAPPAVRVSSIKYVKRDPIHYLGIFANRKVPFHVAYNSEKAELIVTMKNAALPAMKKALHADPDVIEEVKQEYVIDNDGSVLSNVRIQLAKPYKYHVTQASFGIKVAIDASQTISAP
ncbi:MAG: hypothetical protein HY391_01150 [Deltaproteobacteria bacterium]|nr:hypothetical protein [Deltaproteobacteria bacterium]